MQFSGELPPFVICKACEICQKRKRKKRKKKEKKNLADLSRIFQEGKNNLTYINMVQGHLLKITRIMDKGNHIPLLLLTLVAKLDFSLLGSKPAFN